MSQRSLLLLAALGLWLALFPAWARWLTAPPLDEPIALTRGAVVARDLRIVPPERHDLTLVFRRSGVPPEELRALLGELGDPAARARDPSAAGVPVPIRWSLSGQDGSVVASGTVEALGTSSWSAADVHRRVATVEVPPGRYRLHAEVLRDVAPLAALDTRLVLWLPPKAGTGWQSGAVWWGTLLNAVLVWPAALLTGLVLLWRAGASAWRQVR